MAITTVGTPSSTVGVTNVTGGSIDFTQATGEVSVQNVIRAKGPDGDVKAVLLTAAKGTFQGSGYSSAGTPMQPGATVNAFGKSFTVTESTAEQTAEDFTRISVTGVCVA